MTKKNRNLIQDKNRAICGNCNQNLFSPFDILFMHYYSACFDCLSEELSEGELEKMAEKIFKLLN